jgi:hypothetical protein
MSVDMVATRIMIFLSEDDRVGHHGLHEALLDRAREDGMAGVTVWRGIEGFGTSGHIRTARFPDADIGLPLAVEVIDLPEEQVQMSRFKPAHAPALDDPDPRDQHRD